MKEPVGKKCLLKTVDGRDRLIVGGRSLHGIGAPAVKDLCQCSLIDITETSAVDFPWNVGCALGSMEPAVHVYTVQVYRRESIRGLVSKQKYFKTNPMLYREPVQINEDRCNVVVFATLSDDTSCMILLPLNSAMSSLRMPEIKLLQ